MQQAKKKYNLFKIIFIILILIFGLYTLLVLYFYSVSDDFKIVRQRCFQVFNATEGLHGDTYECVTLIDFNISEINITKIEYYENIFNRTEEYIRDDKSLDYIKNISR